MSAAKKELLLSDETKLALLEQSISHIHDAIERIDVHFDRLEKELEKLDDKLTTQFKWMIGMMVTLFSGLYATVIGGVIARICGVI